MNPENTNILPIGTVLCNGDRKYRIVKVLGQGGFGITYLAIGEVVVDNVVAEGKFAIKEHFPSAYCERKGTEVTASEENRSNYESSKHDFVAEARKLHVFGTKNENIVKVNEVFEENGTAYYVMQYINGESLLSYVRNHGKLSYNEAMKILLPIINAVGFLHKSRINHLDIKPDNIMLHDSLEGTVPVLVDFGLSIHFKKNGDKTSPKNVLGVSEGYSPLEQYAGISEFLPAADIYALVATLLYAMTGTTPKSATELKVSDVRNAFKDRLPDNIIDGICKALNKSYEDRTPSIEVLKADLGLAGPGTATRVIDLDHDKRESKGKKGEGNKKIMLIAGAGVVLGLIIAAAFIFRPSPSEVLADGGGTVIAPDTVVAIQRTDTVKQPVSKDNSVVEKDKEISVQDTEKPIRTSAEAGTETGTVSEKPTVGAVKDNAVDSDPAPVKPKKTEEVTNGTLSLGYGTWVGGIKNGKPDGKGKLTFTTRHKVDRSSSEEANPGDYFVATYDAGSLISGKLYDSSGNVLKTITP
ncbi:MAG: serine/threonine protein kinase [Muribaculaceae bacterium]|nr:serine/threonine protein kinase [Muribaculaceae bacterium]